MAVLTYNLNTGDTETGESWGWLTSQPSEISEFQIQGETLPE